MTVVAVAIGVLGASSVAVVPPIRRTLGYDTTQYFGREPQEVASRLSWTKEVGEKPELVE